MSIETLMLFLVRILNPRDINNAEMYLSGTMDGCLGLIIFVHSTFNSSTLDSGPILLCK